MKNVIQILFVFAGLLYLSSDVKSQIVVEENKYDEFIQDDKLYKPYSNWLSLNFGEGYNFHKKESLYINDSLVHTITSVDVNLSLNYHFRINDLWFDFGWHHSSEIFLLYSMYRPSIRIDELFLGVGYCIDEKKYHFSGFISPSLCIGNYYNPIPKLDSLGNKYGYYFFTSYREPGINIKIEYTYKIFYDFGIGVSAYATLNRRYPLVGLQLHIYFSGAYKGNVN